MVLSLCSITYLHSRDGGGDGLTNRMYEWVGELMDEPTDRQMERCSVTAYVKTECSR